MSWIIVHRETGDVVMETFSRGVVRKVNTDKYRAVPILEWLASLSDTATCKQSLQVPTPHAATQQEASETWQK